MQRYLFYFCKNLKNNTKYQCEKKNRAFLHFSQTKNAYFKEQHSAPSQVNKNIDECFAYCKLDDNCYSIDYENKMCIFNLFTEFTKRLNATNCDLFMLQCCTSCKFGLIL